VVGFGPTAAGKAAIAVVMSCAKAGARASLVGNAVKVFPSNRTL
jgi:hypothetical protein